MGAPPSPGIKVSNVVNGPTAVSPLDGTSDGKLPFRVRSRFGRLPEAVVPPAPNSRSSRQIADGLLLGCAEANSCRYSANPCVHLAKARKYVIDEVSDISCFAAFEAPNTYTKLFSSGVNNAYGLTPFG